MVERRVSLAKWVVKRDGETLAEFESRQEAVNEIYWYEVCDMKVGLYEDDAYEIVKVEI